MKAGYLLSADLDVQVIYNTLDKWCEGQGDLFLDALEEVTALLETFPYSGRLHFDDYRRIVMRQFPYGIFYVVESNRIMIHAVLNLRQSPEAIRRRLSIDGAP